MSGKKNETPAVRSSSSTSFCELNRNFDYWAKLKEILRISPWQPFFAKLFHWDNPSYSALVFISGNSFFILIIFFEYSVMTLVARILFTSILFSLIYVKFWEARNHPHPLMQYLQSFELKTSPYTIAAQNAFVLAMLKLVQRFLLDILYATNLHLAFRTIIFMIMLSFIGSRVPGIYLTYFIFLFSFIWPPAYASRQACIDHFRLKVSTLLNSLDKFFLQKPLHRSHLE